MRNFGDHQTGIKMAVDVKFLKHETVAIILLVKHLSLDFLKGVVVIALPNIDSYLGFKVVGEVLGPVKKEGDVDFLEGINDVGSGGDGENMLMERDEKDADGSQSEVADREFLLDVAGDLETNIIAGLDFDYLHVRVGRAK